MKSLLLGPINAIPVILAISFSLSIQAQTNLNFQYTISNETSTPNWIEFDLLLVNLDPATPFQLSTIQSGILVNPAIYNGGAITASIVPGSSTLVSVQVPITITFTQSANCIKIAPKAPPGCGSGTIISQDPQNPTRICRVKLTSSTAWPACSTDNMIFNFNATPYPTKIFCYDASCIGTALTVNSSNCFNNTGNPPLNTTIPPPIGFTVTGGGTYCENASGMPVQLNGSEPDVTYTLFKNGVPQPQIVNGTGNAISFGIQLEGTYTVLGTRACSMTGNSLSSPMSGSVVVTAADTTLPGIVLGPDSAVEGNTTIQLSLSGNNGTVVNWQKALDAGPWTDIASATSSLSVIPDNTGIWHYRAIVQNGPCASAASAEKTVIVTARTLLVKLYLQGLYRTASLQMDKAQDENGDHFGGDTADVISIRLAHNAPPYSIDYNLGTVSLSAIGIASRPLPGGSSSSYYIVINHRNSVETWSSFPVNLSNVNTYYNFTNGVYKAYGYNMMQMGSSWVLFTGDVNQDGIIDSGDMISAENQASAFTTGYVNEDNNGDGLVDSTDMSMIGNHAAQFIGKVTP